MAKIELSKSVKKSLKLIDSLRSGKIVSKKFVDSNLLNNFEANVNTIVELVEEVDDLKESLKTKRNEIVLRTEEVKLIRKKLKKSIHKPDKLKNKNKG